MKNQLENQKVSGVPRWQVLLALLNLAILQNCSQDTSFSETTPSNADVIAGKYRPLDTNSSQFERGVLSIAPYTAPSQAFSLINDITTVNIVQADNNKNYTETFHQGARGEHRVEEFELMEPHKLDLLLMVDDSSSMDSYKAELGNKMESLLGHISNTNWRIGVITTTESCLNTLPKIRNASEADENTVFYLDKAMYDADPAGTKAKFKALVQQDGFRASPNEQGIKTVVDALTGADARCMSINGKKSNFWMREGSTKSIVLVSDERNCGSADGDACYTLDASENEIKRTGPTPLPWESADYFTGNEDIQKMKVTVHGLLLTQQVVRDPATADPSDPCLGSRGAFKYPTAYKSLIDRAARPGEIADVCLDFDRYDSILSKISESMKDQVVKTYTVSQVPMNDANSVKVTVNGERFFDFTVTGSTVFFNSDLADTAGTVRIDYYGLPETQKDYFALRTYAKLKDDSIVVKVNGIPVADTAYELVKDGLLRAIKFHSFPSFGARIDISYQDELLQSKFRYEGEMMADTLVVTINGEVKTDITVHPELGIIETGDIGEELDQVLGRAGPPPAGSTIVMKYNKAGMRKVVYPADIAYKDGIRYKLVDVRTGDEVASTYSPAGIEIADEALIHGRKVIATFDDTLDDQNDQRVSLAFANKPYTMKAMKVDATKLPAACAERLDITEQGLKLVCNNDALAGKVDIPYSFPIDYRNAFDVTQTTKIIDKYTKFYIEVNGVEISLDDYALDGKKIVIDRAKLPIAAKVYIKALN